MLFTPDSERALGERLEQILNDPEVTNRARAAIPSLPTVTTQASILLDLYERARSEYKANRQPSEALEFRRALARVRLRAIRSQQLREAIGQIIQLKDRIQGLVSAMEQATVSVEAERATEAAYLAELHTLKGERAKLVAEYRRSEQERDQVRGEFENLVTDRDRTIVETHRAWRAVEDNHRLIRSLEAQLSESRSRPADIVMRRAKEEPAPCNSTQNSQSEGAQRTLLQEQESLLRSMKELERRHPRCLHHPRKRSGLYPAYTQRLHPL
jgi:chromosome segregation ATPase